VSQDGLFDNPPPPILCEHANCRKEIAYRTVGDLGRWRWIHVATNQSQCDSSGTQWARPAKGSLCPRCDKPMPREYCWDGCQVRGECPLGFVGRYVQEGAVRVVTPEEFLKLRAEEAHARRGDPVTSHEAAASIKSEEIRRSQQAVLQCFRWHGPMHDVALVKHYMADAGTGSADFPKQSESGIRTRRSELVTKGVLEDSGQKAVLPSGRRAIIWRIKR
jgi:hypothetical protein